MDTGNVTLIAEVPVDSRSVWGTVNSPPDNSMIDRFATEGRGRYQFACNLCGLNAGLRAKAAELIMNGLQREEAFLYERRGVPGAGPDEYIDTHTTILHLGELVAIL